MEQKKGTPVLTFAGAMDGRDGSGQTGNPFASDKYTARPPVCQVAMFGSADELLLAVIRGKRLEIWHAPTSELEDAHDAACEAVRRFEAWEENRPSVMDYIEADHYVTMLRAVLRARYRQRGFCGRGGVAL